MNRDLVGEFAERLRGARAELCRTVAQTDDELRTLEAHQPGAPGEDASTELVTAVLSRLEGREKHELDEIHAAQARLAAGTYGVCDISGEDIESDRLMANPAATTCKKHMDVAP